MSHMRIHHATMTSLLLLCVGCSDEPAGTGSGGAGGVGGSGGSGDDVTAPTVTSITPADAAIDASIHTAIDVVFSEPLDASTVVEGAVTLALAGETLPGTITYEAGSLNVVFEPAQPLVLIGEYTVVVAGVSDLAGNSFVGSFESSFWSQDGAWGEAQLIETADVDSAYEHSVAVDGDGNAWATWLLSPGQGGDAWSNRYTKGMGWGTPAHLETDPESSNSAKVVMNAAGDGLAMWRQVNRIIVSHYVVGTGWSVPEPISPGGLVSVVWPDVAMDESGNVVVVWAHRDASAEYHIWGATYEANVGWGPAARIGPTGSVASLPNVAIDSSTGTAIAVWEQENGSVHDIWVSRRDKGQWSAPMLLEENTDDARSAQVVMGGDGHAIATWYLFGESQTWARIFTPQTGWGAPELVSEGIGGVAMDADGNAMIAHVQSGSIWARRYLVDGGWLDPTPIETMTGVANSPSLASDPRGNAIALWFQRSDVDTRADIWANRFTVRDGWGTPVLIELSEIGDAYTPRLAVGANGDVVGLWPQYSEPEGTPSRRDMVANVFSVPLR